MILGPNELTWQEQVTRAAQERGWRVYVQDRANQAQAWPSLVLVRHRVLLVYLRTTLRGDRPPPADQMAALTGAETVVWSKRDWAMVLLTLTDRAKP